MSGIVGYIGSKPAALIVYELLKRVEYRGYDSFGIAMLNAKIEIAKKAARFQMRVPSLTVFQAQPGSAIPEKQQSVFLMIEMPIHIPTAPAVLPLSMMGSLRTIPNSNRVL